MKQIWPTAIALLVISASACLVLMYGRYNTSYDTSRFDMVQYYGQQFDLSPKQPMDAELMMKREGVDAPPREEGVGGGRSRLHC